MKFFVQKNTSKITTVAVSFEAGSGLESQHNLKKGVAHFLEHFMFKGTSKRDCFQRSKEMAFLGADENAFTSHSNVAYYFSVMEDALDKSLDIFSDMIFNPIFPEAEFEKEKNVILEELASSNDEVTHVMGDELYKNFYSNYLSVPVIGTEESIKSIQLEDLKDFYNRFYKKENMVISVQSSLKKNVVIDLLTKYFGAEDGEAKNLLTPVGSSLSEIKEVVINRQDLEQAHVYYAYPSPKRGTKEAMAASVLSTILGGGMDSRLFQEVREKNNLVYGISAGSYAEKTAGMFVINLSTRLQNLEAAKDLVKKELERIISEPPSEEELERSKNKSKLGLYRSFQSPESSAFRIIDNYFFNGKVASMDSISKKLNKVTIQDVVSIAEKTFSSPYVYVVAKKQEAE